MTYAVTSGVFNFNSQAYIFFRPMTILSTESNYTSSYSALTLPPFGEAPNMKESEVDSHNLISLGVDPSQLEFSADGLVVFDRNTSCSEKLISLVSRHLARFLELHVPDICTVNDPQGQTRTEPISRKIANLFAFVSKYAYLQAGELINTSILIQRLVKRDEEDQLPNDRRVVSSSSIGTVLMCACLLSNKACRDIPIRSEWWAKAFNMPLEVLNSSEGVFLDRLRWGVHATEEELTILGTEIMML
ncbi:hypothetical protein BLNAU_13649 [Blattamonas nauphoetae]|uniref:Cyclin N-terminal domain-containing protein n=1 Tax=Blattamonas nauphoetae TaxID=2049346 RepID=A0ABQ9XKL0_9EUKA|nr:hypothetical protein BLNAU_13649 [Blattamonas nauphoetae]